MKQKSGRCSRQPRIVIGSMQTDKKKNVKNSLALKENNVLNKTGKFFI